MFLCVGLTIGFLHGRSFETLLQSVILGSGLFTRVMMGLSPTIYASGERTSLYCSVAILIVCLRNLEIYWKEWDGCGKPGQKSGKIVLGIYIAALICVSVWGSKLALQRQGMLSTYYSSSGMQCDWYFQFCLKLTATHSIISKKLR